jgi:hypothetical protein
MGITGDHELRECGDVRRNDGQGDQVDPLDQLSDCLHPDGHEMTFRELSVFCGKDFKLLDSLEPRDRYIVQKANDKNWTPLQPYEGLRRHKRRRV